MTAKKALKTDPANRRSPAGRPRTSGKTCEWVTVMDCNMTCAVGKRMRQRLTFDVRGRRSGEAAKGTHKRSLWAVPLDGIVRAFLDHF